MKAKKCKTKVVIELTLADKATAERAAKRQVEMEMGLRRSTHRIHTSKKVYRRSSKHELVNV